MSLVLAYIYIYIWRCFKIFVVHSRVIYIISLVLTRIQFFTEILFDISYHNWTDVNNDKRICFEEFRMYTLDTMYRVFKAFDKNGDGILCIKEVSDALQALSIPGNAAVSKSF